MEGWVLADWIDLGISGTAVFAVIFGLLIPRWTHIQRIADLKEQRDEWRAMATKLMDNNEVTVKLLEEIRREAAKQ